MGTLKPQSNGPLYSNTVIDKLAVDGFAVLIRATVPGAAVSPSPLLAVPNLIAHRSTASVPTHIIRCGTIINHCTLKG